MALLGATTVQVGAIAVAIAGYLFPRRTKAGHPSPRPCKRPIAGDPGLGTPKGGPHPYAVTRERDLISPKIAANGAGAGAGACYAYVHVSTLAQADEARARGPAAHPRVLRPDAAPAADDGRTFIERGVSGSKPLRDRPRARHCWASCSPVMWC